MSISSDASVVGLLGGEVDSLRYGLINCDPIEAPGLIRRMMPSGVRVLDVGCGVGALTVAVNDGKGNDVTCIEPDTDRAKASLERGLNVYNGVLSSAFFKDKGSFDVIVFADVLEHLIDPAEMLKVAAAGLAPGGVIISSVPNVAHWTVRLNLLFGRFNYSHWGIMDVTHLRWFTTKSMRALYQNCGLEIVEMTHSAGTFLNVYQRKPISLLPKRITRPVIGFLTRLLPGPFGCQHIIMARSVEVRA